MKSLVLGEAAGPARQQWVPPSDRRLLRLSAARVVVEPLFDPGAGKESRRRGRETTLDFLRTWHYMHRVAGAKDPAMTWSFGYYIDGDLAGVVVLNPPAAGVCGSTATTWGGGRIYAASNAWWAGRSASATWRGFIDPTTGARMSRKCGGRNRKVEERPDGWEIERGSVLNRFLWFLGPQEGDARAALRGQVQVGVRRGLFPVWVRPAETVKRERRYYGPAACSVL